MARGGARPGAGRKPKAISDAVKACEIAAKRSKGEMTPLDFMLALMRDDDQDVKLRAAMAQSAAPYCHPKVEASPKGKKEEKQEAANTAASKFAPATPPKLVVNNK